MPASTEPPRRLRGVIFGSGGVARHAHLPAFQHDPAVRERIEIVAVVDGADDLPPLDGIPILRTPDALAELGPVDFIDVCTPTKSHVDLTLWGIAQGYHVICEKPVATSRAEATRIRAAAAAAARVVAPCHQYRFNPVWGRIRTWLEEGRIGRWHLAELSVHRPGADPGAHAAATPWRGTRAESAGGVLLDHGTHLFYQAIDFAGMPTAVTAWTGRLHHASYDVEDTATVLLAYPDRAVHMLLTWAGGRRDNLVRFIGDAGVIEWAGGELRLETAAGVERVDVSRELDKRIYHRWFARLFDGFVAAVDQADGKAYLDDIERVAVVLETAYASAAAGRTLALDSSS